MCEYCKNSDVEVNHLLNPPKCLSCGKIMMACYDSIQHRISGFIWRCECTPIGMQMMLA